MLKKHNRIRQIMALAITMFLISANVSANIGGSNMKTVRSYLNYLGSANASAIVSLFESGASVWSTSQGQTPAQKFFYGFLPTISGSSVSVYSISKVDALHYKASFKFTWINESGVREGGDFHDEFVFSNGRDHKLASVIMHEGA
jgi:hypothetical protein